MIIRRLGLFFTLLWCLYAAGITDGFASNFWEVTSLSVLVYGFIFVLAKHDWSLKEKEPGATLPLGPVRARAVVITCVFLAIMLAIWEWMDSIFP